MDNLLRPTHRRGTLTIFDIAVEWHVLRLQSLRLDAFRGGSGGGIILVAVIIITFVFVVGIIIEKDGVNKVDRSSSLVEGSFPGALDSALEEGAIGSMTNNDGKGGLKFDAFAVF